MPPFTIRVLPLPEYKSHQTCVCDIEHAKARGQSDREQQTSKNPSALLSQLMFYLFFQLPPFFFVPFLCSERWHSGQCPFLVLTIFWQNEQYGFPCPECFLLNPISTTSNVLLRERQYKEYSRNESDDDCYEKIDSPFRSISEIPKTRCQKSRTRRNPRSSDRTENKRDSPQPPVCYNSLHRSPPCFGSRGW